MKQYLEIFYVFYYIKYLNILNIITYCIYKLADMGSWFWFEWLSITTFQNLCLINPIYPSQALAAEVNKIICNEFTNLRVYFKITWSSWVHEAFCLFSRGYIALRLNFEPEIHVSRAMFLSVGLLTLLLGFPQEMHFYPILCKLVFVISSHYLFCHSTLDFPSMPGTGTCCDLWISPEISRASLPQRFSSSWPQPRNKDIFLLNPGCF